MWTPTFAGNAISGQNKRGAFEFEEDPIMTDESTKPEGGAVRSGNDSKRGRTIVDHILDGEPWPDDVVESINQRSRDVGRISI
jgi:hypothetical protein